MKLRRDPDSIADLRRALAQREDYELFDIVGVRSHAALDALPDNELVDRLETRVNAIIEFAERFQTALAKSVVRMAEAFTESAAEERKP